jgi:hypothetical protein
MSERRTVAKTTEQILADSGEVVMPAEREWPDPDISQDPGIPGTKTPEELPPHDAPEVERVPDTGPPDVDDEGHMAPERPNRARRAEDDAA